MVPVVMPSRALRAVAVADVSVTVKAYALLVPVRVERAEIDPASIVAVITPEVWPSMLLACATVAVPLLMLTATSPAVLMEAELIAVSIAAAVPVRVPTEAALTATVVLPSRVLRAAASTEESPTVMV